MDVYALNDYGYSEYQLDVTIPEEVRDKASEWEKETRKWRKDVENLIKTQHDGTREHVTDEADRTVSEVNANTNSAKAEINANTNNAKAEINNNISNAKTAINNNTDARAAEIKAKEDSTYSLLQQVWNKVKDMI